MSGTMKARLEQLGQNVESLTKDKAEAAARLEELRKQKAAADARLARGGAVPGHQGGMTGKVLSAAGFAEFDPVVVNDSDEHRAQNRRIEIVLQPNIGDLPNLDDLTK